MYGELWIIAKTAGHILAELWWFVVLAIAIASIMSAFKLDKKVSLYFHRAKGWAILGALLLGLVSPL